MGARVTPGGVHGRELKPKVFPPASWDAEGPLDTGKFLNNFIHKRPQRSVSRPIRLLYFPSAVGLSTDRVP